MIKHWIIYGILSLAVATLLILLHLQTALQQHHDDCSELALGYMSEWVSAGETNAVCEAITNAHAIMSESGFNGISFEKIVYLSQPDTKKSEQEISGD